MGNYTRREWRICRFGRFADGQGIGVGLVGCMKFAVEAEIEAAVADIEVAHIESLVTEVDSGLVEEIVVAEECLVG